MNAGVDFCVFNTSAELNWSLLEATLETGTTQYANLIQEVQFVPVGVIKNSSTRSTCHREGISPNNAHTQLKYEFREGGSRDPQGRGVSCDKQGVIRIIRIRLVSIQQRRDSKCLFFDKKAPPGETVAAVEDTEGHHQEQI